MAEFSQVRGATNGQSLGGGTAWSNPTNIITQDGSFSISDIAKNNVSQWLRGYNFNFSLEPDATVLGIQMRVRLKSENSNQVSDSQVYLTDTAGSNKGANKATGTGWPTSDTDFTYGGPTDLWGATWSKDDINNVNFGTQIEAANSTGIGARRAEVDYIEMTVFYERPDPQGMLLQMGAF